MAQTITQAQNSVLKTNFLDSSGSERGPALNLPESEAALVMLAGYLIEEAEKNLANRGTTSSGALASSHIANPPEIIGGNIKIDVLALDYYKFINKGVRGTKSGNGLYSFKTDYPSKEMVKSIREWMRIAKVSMRNSPKKTISKNESKKASVSQLDNAYAVARSIKMKGIKPTGYFDKAVKAAQSKAKETLGQALVVDVINSLPKKLNTK